PELNGFEATRQIREFETKTGSTQSIPIVALTANAIQGDRERCLEAGMNDYVSKPIDPDLLLKVIATQLTGNRQTVANTSAAQAGQTAPGSQPDGPNSHIDAASLIRRCCGKTALAEQLLGKFATQIPDQLKSLEQAAGQRDLEAIGRLAHT